MIQKPSVFILILFMVMTGLVMTGGCMGEDTSVQHNETATTVSYQDQEFVSLVGESGSELKGLFAEITEALQDSDAAGVITSSVAVMETSDTYLAAIEALTVSPAFEPVKSSYLNALEDYAKAGFNYGLAGEYLREGDFTKVENFIGKGDENLLAAAEHIALMYDAAE